MIYDIIPYTHPFSNLRKIQESHIIKWREILPETIYSSQVFHKLVRKQIVHRVHHESQIFDFKGLRFFFWFLHHVIESFEPKFRHFHILSIKTALFVDSSWILQTLSIKTAIFMDSKRLCTESQGIWWGVQIVPGTETRYRISELKQNVYLYCWMQSR